MTDLRRLLEKLNDQTTRALESAVGFSIARGHYEVSVEHLLIKLLEEGAGDVPRILDRTGVDTDRLWGELLRHLDSFRAGNSGRPAFSPVLARVAESAWVIASVHHGGERIRSSHLLIAILRDDALRYAPWAGALASLAPEAIDVDLRNLTDGSEEVTVSVPTRSGKAVQGEPAPAGDGYLERFTLDMTEWARQGNIDPVLGRDEEIRRMIDILCRRRKNNPILVGDAGVGKTAIVEGLALRIAEGDVPTVLAEVEIRSLDLGLLQAGAGVKGEFEKRLKGVIDEVQGSDTPIILFIDEAHTLIGAGGAAGTADAANLLKPALARGEVRTIAATTWSEYKQYVERDPALERRFQLVKVEEPSVEAAAGMMRGIRDSYERHHQVSIPDDAIRALVELSDRFLSGRRLPDKAVDLMDTAAARVRMSQSARPAALDMLVRQAHELNLLMEALRRDERAGLPVDAKEIDALEAKVAAMAEEHDALETKWELERAAARRLLNALAIQDDETVRRERVTQARAELARIREDQALVETEVTPSVVARVVADWTGIPTGTVLRDQATTLLQLESRLRERIIGQDEAIEDLGDAIRAAKAGVGAPDAPIGVFLLIGPSGVGKTECARALADLLFGGERFLVTINLSEYQEAHTVSQLKGSPPGYVGYGEGGVLTEAVRQRPYSVVLLDEVEKAHPDVLNLFMQVFDKGVMRDGEGREIDFRNTVIVLTSNLGSEVFLQAAAEDQERPAAEQMKELAHHLVKKSLPPALLGRMRLLPFYPLHGEELRGVVRMKLDRMVRRLAEGQGVALGYSDAAIEQLAIRCSLPELGARAIDRALDRSILPAVSRRLLGSMADDEAVPALRIDVDAAGGLLVLAEGEPVPEVPVPERSEEEEAAAEPSDETDEEVVLTAAVD